MAYHRYKISNGWYWGSYDDPSEVEADPTCDVTEVDPPYVTDHYDEIQVWKGDGWVVEQRTENPLE